jgi:cytochrome c-type biogenesis protein
MGVGYGKSTLVGGSFAIGWTPCLGPVIGSILTLAGASSSAWTGLYLLVAYSAGVSLPFLVAAMAIGDVSPKLRAIQRYAPFIEAATAVMIIGLGVLLWTNSLTGLNEFFDFGGPTEGL